MVAEEGPTSQGPEEGEATGGIHVAENMVVLDEPEVGCDQAEEEFRAIRLPWLDWVNSEFSKSNLGRGTYSVVRGPPESRGLQSQIWVLLGHLSWSMPGLRTLLRGPGTNGV
ncbi:hypothetical protein TIFTF001_049433 [Ficus carica]|uniref:Uncharacterized protein n=1 Tax=Ficus carica TaxID=3494 RepID=A0AA88CRA4_FICCA|nr:hypothetical protein TIFTF001_049422 [Ficus carica]GMN28134.1 hypothetical protein TIFTF001_049425 [Ficus carica]GMN28150.1 hypothetical protein TIFTF001_049430 [Ficus carica]GMN28175.1 hypothetical protein TIFTF001_049433 [Ficus carica]